MKGNLIAYCYCVSAGGQAITPVSDEHVISEDGEEQV